MGNLPSGTVTFLFTDIEGSTRLWEERPDAMALALARHDHLLRSSIEAEGGFVFKSAGDAFCAAFTTAAEALNGAITAQTALETEPWPGDIRLRARMALHTGTAEERDGDYFGQALNRAARLLAAAHGGQTLLADVTHGLTIDALPPTVALQDLGEHRLKDLGRPERVFQLCHPALHSDFPPLRSLDNFPNNLPQQVTSFIGRETEVAQLLALMKITRLLTITGVGGAGKSRLALQVAADLLEGMPDGVWLAELAPVADPALIPQVVAEVLGVREEAGRAITRTLIEALKRKRLLLVLDNCEHVLPACATLVDELRRVCPDIHVLISSREALGITGEQTYRIPPLSVPDPKQQQTALSLSQYESVHLFSERAKLVQPSFTVTDTNAQAVAGVCHRLDGIPLAIELAAARVRALTVEQIAARLDDRFRLLTGGSRTALPRQQTLRALIDWSYDLLTDQERALLGALSVFLGGWTLAAAEAVCTGGQTEEWEVLDLLSSLVDKSLVVYDSHEECDARYRLLETVRQYSLDRLRESGNGQIVRQRHADWFLALAEEAAPHVREADQASWLGRLETEYDNLRVALEWHLSGEENTEAGLRLAGSLWRFWDVHGHWTEGRAWFDRALRSKGEATPASRARGLCCAGFLAYSQGDYASMAAMAQEGLTLSREIGDGRRAGAASVLLGFAAYAKSDLVAAATFAEESLTLSRAVEDPWQICAALYLLGKVVMMQGDLARATTLLEECLTRMRAIKEPTGMGFALWSLGEVRRREGDSEAARLFFRESLTHFSSVADRRGVALALEGLAGVISDSLLAARLLGAAQHLREEVGVPVEPAARPDRDIQVEAVKNTLGTKAFGEAWTAGRTTPWEQAVEAALTQTE